jgi:catechol 2,3-dioxygenase-like lactoylglutathione lyase family enzyme
MAIFTHVTVGTNDLAKARAFYDSVLAPLGYKRLKDLGDRGSCWGCDQRGIPGADPGRRQARKPC